MNEPVNINGILVTKTNYGNIVSLDDKNIQNCIQLIKEYNPRRLSIYTSRTAKPSYNLDNLELLKLIDFSVDEIIVTSTEIKDWTGLYYLKSLHTLTAFWIDNVVLDFSKIKGLKNLWVNWNKKQLNLFILKDLEELHLWKYKSKNESLEELENLESLFVLEIVQSNIKSIKGIEKLNILKSLSLSYNKNLEILKDEITEPLLNIEMLHIEMCKKVNFDFIKLFPNLKKLEIVNNGTISSLRPILNGLPKLEELFIGETLIEESENEYYKDYINIKKFFFAERKHHKLKLKELGKW